ncbi:MAG: hypothetical protein QF744_14060 [SAR202 cluster bacterium]|jgi:hypothetical protein|nr:hypothetical protein [SAR202 cluster bacterium]
MAGGSVVYGGLSWTGMDPVIELPDGGGQVNVVFSVPPGTWCKIDGPIDVDIVAPAGSRLLYEQNGQCGVTTDTQLTSGDDSSFSVHGQFDTLNKKDNFPFQVMISVDGVEQTTCSGNAKHGVSCEIALDDRGSEVTLDAKDHREKGKGAGKGRDRKKR